MKCQVWYATAYTKIKPYAEISLVLRAILYASFIARLLAQPLHQTAKSVVKSPSHIHTLQTEVGLILFYRGDRKASCIRVHCMILCSKRDHP